MNSLKDDLNEILELFTEFKEYTNVLARQNNDSQCKINFLNHELDLYKKQIDKLNTENEWKTECMIKYRDILSGLTTIEAKYQSALKVKIDLEEALKFERNVNQNQKAEWEKEKIVLLEEHVKVMDEANNKNKILNDEIHNLKYCHEQEVISLKDAHKKELEEFSNILSQNIKKYEEKLKKVNQDLKTTEKELLNIRHAKEQKEYLESVNNSDSDDIEAISVKRSDPRQIQVQTKKIVKFPTVMRKRKLFTQNVDTDL